MSRIHLRLSLPPRTDSPDRFIPALVLAEVAAMKQPATVVVPRGLYKPERVLCLDDGYRSRRIRARRLVEYSGTFERFEFSDGWGVATLAG